MPLFSARRTRRAWPQDNYRELPVRAPTIAPSVTPFEYFMEAIYRIGILHALGLGEVGRDTIALCIDIWPDVVSNLPGRITQADTLVEGRRTEPYGLPVLQLVPAPEANMMSLPGTAAHRLLEREVLLPPEEVQVAHRCLVVGSPKDRVRSDAQTRS